jgi:hypothetical protein
VPPNALTGTAMARDAARPVGMGDLRGDNGDVAGHVAGLPRKMGGPRIPNWTAAVLKERQANQLVTLKGLWSLWRHASGSADGLYGRAHMPRSVEEILKHADELAKRFEDYESKPEDGRNVDAVLALRDAVVEWSEAERHLSGAVARARAAGLPWSTIGTRIGKSGEAARQRYGKTVA